MTHQPTVVYRIFGAEMSPYSVKVRSYLRYKNIPHHWILRNAESEAGYAWHARLPIMPLVVAPDEVPMQDSTPIIDPLNGHRRVRRREATNGSSIIAGRAAFLHDRSRLDVVLQEIAAALACSRIRPEPSRRKCGNDDRKSAAGALA